MALSGTRDDADTVASMTTDILRKLQVLQGGETASAEDANTVLRAIRHMLRTWQVQGVQLHLWVDQTVTPVAGTSSYALSIRALEIGQGWRRTSGSDTPLRMYSREEYNRLPDKAASGSPFIAFVDQDRATTNIVTYPVPDATSAANDVLYFPCKVPVQDALLVAQNIDLPPEWSEAILWNAAKRLVPEFPGQAPEATQTIMMMAQETYDVLAGHDREGSVFMRPARYS